MQLRLTLLFASLVWSVRAFVGQPISTTGRLLAISLLRDTHQEEPSTTSSSCESDIANNRQRLDRRKLLQQATASTAMLAILSINPVVEKANAAIDVSSIPSTSTTLPSTSSSTTSATYLDPDQAKVTDKVFFDVRISRQDGTFYVRDDLPDTPENRVFRGRLVVGLFGEAAPNHVARFRSYVNPVTVENAWEQDDPLPSYGRSVFSSLDQATGLLTGGRIPALEATTVNGSPALRYGGRLLSSSLWVDPPPRLAHSRRGLLTHRRLEALPVFGITTRADSRVYLDASYTVFGKILWDDSSQEFLDIVRDLPTYSMDAMVTTSLDRVGDDKTLVEEGARAVFAAQRTFFRQTAKALGDTRLDKVYEGKLLRRVEVTRVGYL